MSLYIYTGSSFNCNLCDYVSVISPNPHTFCKMHYKKVHPGAIIPLKSEVLNFKMNSKSSMHPPPANKGNIGIEFHSDVEALKLMNK